MSKIKISDYDPKTNKFPYTELTDQHYLHVKKNNGLVFDGNYPYVDTSKSFLFKRKLVRIFILTLVVYPVMSIRLGLRVKGRENLKKYKSVIKKGIVSVCNHVQMWDFLALTKAVRFHVPNILVWANNVRGENALAIRMMGGIPIPDDNLAGSIAMNRSVDKFLNNGGWLHVYSEGSMWEYYKPIRPFKRGAAYFAVKNDKPILPMAISYRRPNWIRRKIFKQIATFTVNIGEPIYPNKSLLLKEREKDLTIRSHEEVCRLAGIDPKDNVYGPIYDNSKRIDYYTDKYGVGYKKSW